MGANEDVPQSSDLDGYENQKCAERDTSGFDEDVAGDVLQEEEIKNENVDEMSQEIPEDSNASKLCIFCHKERKFHKGQWQALHACGSEDAIKSIAEEMNDTAFIEKIDNMCAQNQLIFYRNICKKKIMSIN